MKPKKSVKLMKPKNLFKVTKFNEAQKSYLPKKPKISLHQNKPNMS